MEILATIWHIIWRSVLHTFGSTGPILAGAFALRFAHKKKGYRWLPDTYLKTLIYSAVVVFVVAMMREPYDVHVGGWFGKSYFDYASWAFGCTFSVIGLKRIRDWENR